MFSLMQKLVTSKVKMTCPLSSVLADGVLVFPIISLAGVVDPHAEAVDVNKRRVGPIMIVS